MKLLNVGAGEISDRLSILALKILYARESGKDTAHFESEQASLRAQIRSRTLNGKWFDGVLELAAVNAAIWHGEDELRAWRVPRPTGYSPEDLVTIMDLAFHLQAMNDRRAELIQTINKDAGDSDAKEKV